MTILYTAQILKLDTNSATIKYRLTPTNTDDVEPLIRTIRISLETLAVIETLPTEMEKLLACRQEMLKGDPGYQADWEAERAAKASSAVSLLGSHVGHVFPATTEEELKSLNTQEHTAPGEVVF